MRFDLSFDTRNPLALLRIRFIQVLAAICIIIAIVGIITRTVLGDLQISGIISGVSLIVVGIFTLLLVRFGRITVASILLIGTLIITLALVNIVGSLFIIATIIVLSAAALTSPVGYMVVNLLVFGRLFIEIYRILERTGLQYSAEVAVVASLTTALVILSGVTRLFIDTAEQSAKESARSAELLRATAEIGQITAVLSKMDEIFNRAVELIRDRFAFYHVQIFLVDEERRYAKLVASTGEIGQKLLARNHRLAIGSQSVIGRVTQIGETVITRDTDTDTVHSVNELLPNTRSELALPIVDG
ncbi:MAG TPA: hypothetical protein VHL11_03835, partial [Phototrophicaceae bacterium]|nr:hypothetical protein [Phototrophicaceae bacterium]